MRTCEHCGGEAAFDAGRRFGLRSSTVYRDTWFCWRCWYFEVANNGMYKRRSSGHTGLIDSRISDQINRANDKALERITPAGRFERLRAEELMLVILKSGALCAVSGDNAPLTFDHITPLAADGDHAFENLRAITKHENWIAEVVFFRSYRAE